MRHKRSTQRRRRTVRGGTTTRSRRSLASQAAPPPPRSPAATMPPPPLRTPSTTERRTGSSSSRKRKLEEEEEEEEEEDVVVVVVAHTPKTPSRGQYGCVYWPSLMLDAAGMLRTDPSDEAEEFVSKLQYDSTAARSEVTIGALVAPLLATTTTKKKKKKEMPIMRFAPVLDAFAVKRAQVPEKVMRKCAVLAEGASPPPGSSENDFLVTKMHAAGRVTMDKHLREFGATHMQLLPIWNELMISLDQLLSVGVVHRDLKSDNVMHGGTSSVVPFVPVVIDFGLAMHAPSLLDERVSSEVAAERWRDVFPALVTDYVVWCPEITLCAALWQLSPLYDGDDLLFEASSASSDSSSASSDSSSSDGSMTEESYWRYHAQDGQPLPPEEVVDARTARRLRAVVAACFQKHPLLRALAKRRPAEIAAKRRRLLALASACAGKSRLAAARHVLRETWRDWDRFSLAGAFLRFRPGDDDEDMEAYTEEYQNDLALLDKKGATKDFKKLLRRTRAFWAEVDRLVLA